MRILYIAVHSQMGWGADDWLHCAFKENGIKTILYNFRKARKTLNELTENPELIKRVSKEIIQRNRTQHLARPAKTIYYQVQPVINQLGQP